MKRLLCALIALIMLLCSASLSAADREVDEEGGVWDYDAGTYTSPDGEVFSISYSDDESSSSSGSSSSGSSGGSGVQDNPDGSITVESGQISAPDTSEGSGPHLTQAEWAARWAKYTAKNGATTGTVYMNDSGEIVPAEIKSLGLACSTIVVEGEEIRVPTSSLRWDTEAPEDKVLAVVTPSSQSYVTVRAKSSKKAFVLEQAQKCKVLRVIRTGKNWSFIDDGGIRGYVLTSGLTFYDNAPRAYANAIITVKGKTPRGNYVHFRSAPTNKAMQSKVEYPVGTDIAVLSQDDEWSEIDLDGFHCYMQTKYVTLKEPLILAEAAPPETDAEPEPGLAPLEP